MKLGPWQRKRQRRQRRARLAGNAGFALLTLVLSGAVFATSWDFARIAATPTDPAARKQRERSVYYANCADARRSGAAPIYSGEPGYRSEMDGDGDGIACEPYRGW